MQRSFVLVQRRAAYLWVLFAIPAVSQFGHYLAPNEPILKGHDYGIVAAAVLTIVAAGLWIPYQKCGSWPRSALLFFVIAAIAWAYQILRIQLDGSLFALTVFVLPAALVLVAFKRPSPHDVWIALWVLGYSLLAIAALSLVLGTLGLTPDGFLVSHGVPSRVPWLAEIAPTRWGGPFGSVNYAAPVGGFLVLIGLSGKRRAGVPLIIGGLLILILSQGRTALFALVVAGAVQVLWGQRVAARAHARLIRVSVLGSLAAALVGYIIFVDRTFNGRVDVWRHFANTFDDSPLVGIGDSGVLKHVEEFVRLENVVPHTHAHSVLLDTYMRFGVILAALGIILYVLSLRATIRGLAQVGSGPLSIVVFVIAAGLTETVYAWAHWSVYLVALTWAVMVSSPDTSSHEREGDETRSLSWVRESG